MKDDIPDLIAGALGVSRGTAYDMMREALAEQQEPVAWRTKTFFENQEGWFYAEWRPDGLIPEFSELLYTFPQPAQRTWVGLTQQEVREIHDMYHKRMGPQEFAKEIEARLKEKNT